jgi:hypothetical protein
VTHCRSNRVKQEAPRLNHFPKCRNFPVSNDKTMYASSRVPSAADINVTAWSNVSDFDGRPAACPRGVSTNAATLRPTRSSRSACRIARSRTLCAICSVRVDS